MIDFLGKDARLRDEPRVQGVSLRDELATAKYQLNRPETLDYIRAMREVADRHGDKVLIGEVIYYLPLKRFADYYGDGRLLDLPTNFRLTFLPFDVDTVRDWVDAYDTALVGLDAWPNYCLGNHDSPRVARLGEQQVRLAAMLLLTLRGTPFLYYGDEIGMSNVDVPADQRRDRAWENERNRDRARTPMLWTDKVNSGFSDENSKPWLPLAGDYRKRNVAVQKDDRRSVLRLTRRLLMLRRELPALTDGSYAPLDGQSAGCYVFRRAHAAGDVLVALNFSADPATVTTNGKSGAITASTGLDREAEPVIGSMRLRPYEGVVITG
jgi:alpha-glucosidase